MNVGQSSKNSEGEKFYLLRSKFKDDGNCDNLECLCHQIEFQSYLAINK